MRKKVHRVGASLRMKCDTTGTVSFNPIAIDKIPVEIRTTFTESKLIIFYFCFSIFLYFSGYMAFVPCLTSEILM